MTKKLQQIKKLAYVTTVPADRVVSNLKIRHFGQIADFDTPDHHTGPRMSKVGIAFCTLCSRMAFDAMHYAMHIIAAFCGILRRYLDVSRSIMDVGV